jgi:hypothetical protein
MAEKGRISMKFSLVPLLLGGESISAEAKRALRENRIEDAADILIAEHEFNCVEVGHLSRIAACADDGSVLASNTFPIV